MLSHRPLHMAIEEYAVVRPLRASFYQQDGGVQTPHLDESSHQAIVADTADEIGIVFPLNSPQLSSRLPENVRAEGLRYRRGLTYGLEEDGLGGCYSNPHWLHRPAGNRHEVLQPEVADWFTLAVLSPDVLQR